MAAGFNNGVLKKYTKEQRIRENVYQKTKNKNVSKNTIENLDENILQILEDTSEEDIIVDVKYYAIYDDDLEKSKQLSESEIKDVLKEVGEVRELDNSFTLYLNPTDIFTKSVSAEYDSETSADGYLRQTVFVTPLGGRYYTATLNAEWLKVPKNMTYDVWGLNFTEAMWTGKESASVKERYMDYRIDTGEYSKYTYINTKVTNIAVCGSEIAATEKINPNKSYYWSSGTIQYKRMIVPVSSTISCQIKTSYADTDSFVVAGKYRHQVYGWSIKPTLSVSTSGASASIVVTGDWHFESLTPNAAVYFQVR